jgi:hypothetical protein
MGLAVKDERFYLLGLEVETMDVLVFILPGNNQIAVMFGAEACDKPVFDASLHDVTVQPASSPRRRVRSRND